MVGCIRRIIYKLCLRIFSLPEAQSKEMRWVCIYCNKVMDRANFTDFIEESNSRFAERHGWRLVADRLPD